MDSFEIYVSISAGVLALGLRKLKRYICVRRYRARSSESGMKTCIILQELSNRRRSENISPKVKVRFRNSIIYTNPIDGELKVGERVIAYCHFCGQKRNSNIIAHAPSHEIEKLIATLTECNVCRNLTEIRW